MLGLFVADCGLNPEAFPHRKRGHLVRGLVIARGARADLRSTLGFALEKG